MELPEPTNSSLLDLLRDLLNLLEKNLLKLLTFTFSGLVIGLLWTFTLTPEFQISAKIGPNLNSQDNPQLSSSSGFISTILQGNETDQLSNLETAMFSYPVAEQLWDQGFNKVFYEIYYDEESDSYRRSKATFKEKFAARILGYNIILEIGPDDLKSLIQQEVDYSTSEFDPNVNIYITTSQPKKFSPFLKSLIVESDKNLKKEKISYATEQIKFLTKKIEESRDVDIKRSLTNSLKSSYLDLALHSNDLPSSYRLIDPVFVSEKPVVPNLKLIFIFFPFLGFFIGFLIIYLKEEKILFR